MIVRVWHGRTPLARGDAYARFLLERALPDYRATAGNLGAGVLRRDEDAVSHFLTVSLWPSREAIVAFAGDDIETAKYYPEDRDFLLEFETSVRHYDLIGAEFGAAIAGFAAV